MRLNKSSALFLLFSFLYSAVVVDSYRFLAVLHTTAEAHYNFGESLLKALAEKGHEIYVIAPYRPEIAPENFHYIHYHTSIDNTRSVFERLDRSVVRNIFRWYKRALEVSENVLTGRNVVELMASNLTFDAVICETYLSESLYGFSERFNAPLIGLSTFGALPWDSDMVGSPSPPSYVPNHLTKLTDHMSLFERCINLMIVIFEKILVEYYYLPRQAILYELNFPMAKSDMYSVRKNAALVLVNSHASFAYPRPHMPNHIQVGGLHISKKRTPLPWHLEKFITEAKHGVVYFSMGANLRSRDITPYKKQVFIEAFKHIKQRVLWKCQYPKMGGKTGNVLTSEEFPQGDVLAQKNVKIFITNGGLVDTTESIYHGTPIIGLSIAGDHLNNLVVAEQRGYGIRLNFDTITPQDIISAINDIMNNKTYTKKVKEISARYKSQPLAPRDLAVYWVEYIVRHKGAKYLHCAGLDLNFFEYHNLDVWGFIILNLFILFYLVDKLLSMI